MCMVLQRGRVRRVVNRDNSGIGSDYDFADLALKIRFAGPSEPWGRSKVCQDTSLVGLNVTCQW